MGDVFEVFAGRHGRWKELRMDPKASHMPEKPSLLSNVPSPPFFLFENRFIFTLCVCEFESMSVPHVHAVPLEARRGAFDPLELELQVVVSLHVGAGNRTSLLCKSNMCS